MLWECDWEIFKRSVFEILILKDVKISMWLDVATLLDAISRVLKQTQITIFNFALWSSRVIINLLFARHLTTRSNIQFKRRRTKKSMTILNNDEKFQQAQKTQILMKKNLTSLNTKSIEKSSSKTKRLTSILMSKSLWAQNDLII